MNNSVKIRRMKEADIPNVIKAGEGTSEFRISPSDREFWSEEELKNWILSEYDVLLVVENEEDEMIGFLTSSFHKPTGKVIGENLWVHKNYRKMGIGSMLLDEHLRLVKEKGATFVSSYVKEDAVLSMKLHDKKGFNQGDKSYWFYKYF